MTNWRPIGSAPKGGREVTVRRTVAGRTTYEGVAVWQPGTAQRQEGWIDARSGERLPEPTHWKATGLGHP